VFVRVKTVLAGALNGRSPRSTSLRSTIRRGVPLVACLASDGHQTPATPRAMSPRALSVPKTIKVKGAAEAAHRLSGVALLAKDQYQP
jgi:hypothetical protein